MESNEKELERIRQISFTLAMNIMKNHDDADDVAQSTMFQFISAVEVQNAEAWTKKVTHHLVMEKFRDQKKNLNIHQKASIVEDNEDETTRKKRELLEINHITQEQVKRYLTAPERKIYKEFLALDFGIKKYADKYKVTYNVAQKRLEMIRRNLKAAYLREKGFNLTATLTYKLISSFIIIAKQLIMKVLLNELKQYGFYILSSTYINKNICQNISSKISTYLLFSCILIIFLSFDFFYFDLF